MTDKLLTELIMGELNYDIYLPQGEQLESIKKKTKKLLEGMEINPYNYRQHIDDSRKLLHELWSKYDCVNVVNLFDKYTNIEPILMDLKPDNGPGQRYRDHSVHTVHVFILGVRIISEFISKLNPNDIRSLFKIKDERISKKINSFTDYDYKARLFYIWCLTSTFHDIGIPLEHLNLIYDGLNSFTNCFETNIKVVGPSLERTMMPDLEEYFDNLSRLFGGNVQLSEDAICYNKESQNIYVKKYLLKKFFDNDHGVIGGYLLFKVIENAFLLGKSGKRNFETMDLFNKYNNYVLLQDVSRASLAISMHNLKLVF